MDNTWWIGRCFFNWVTPLIHFSKKHQSLKLKSLGNMRECDKVEPEILKL